VNFLKALSREEIVTFITGCCYSRCILLLLIASLFLCLICKLIFAGGLHVQGRTVYVGLGAARHHWGSLGSRWLSSAAGGSAQTAKGDGWVSPRGSLGRT
jgi:hypothetical protein